MISRINLLNKMNALLIKNTKKYNRVIFIVSKILKILKIIFEIINMSVFYLVSDE